MNGTDVTNSHEPSYYEIALTNRQVVVAFILLLVCLLSAFFSGVWIGRESAARTAEKLAANSGPAPQEPKEGRSLEEFQFFDKPQEKGETPPEPTTRETPRQDTTLLEDMSGGDEDDFAPMDEEAGASQDAKAGNEGGAATAPTPAQTPRTAAERREEKRRQRQQERQAAAAASTAGGAGGAGEDTVRPRPLPEASPAGTGGSGSRQAGGKVVIQVFSSPEKDQAERIQQRLAGGGQRAFLSPVTVGGRTMYRVRIGPFTSRDDAQKVAEQVRKGYKLDTWVTE